MKKKPITEFMDFISLLEEQKNGEFEFPKLEHVILSLCMSDNMEINDTVIPVGTGEFVALISYNIFPDEMEFVNKIGNFVVVIMEIAHLNRVFVTRRPLITWTIPKK